MAENDAVPASPPGPEPEPSAGQLNDQVKDAIAQLNAIFDGTDSRTFQVAAYQTFVHVVALAMHNAVAEQQQNQILRIALTTAAAKAILAGRKDEAESILEITQSKLAGPDVAGLLAQVRQFIDAVGRELATHKATPPNA